MRRVNPFETGIDQDNYYIHLARYMFCVRQLKKTQSVLEIGCGIGYGARLLSDYAQEVYATDTETSLQEAWNKYDKENLHFVTNIDQIDDLKKFDVVVSFEVVEHIEENDLEQYFKLINSRVKPNGFVFMSTPRAVPFEERSKNRQIEHKIEYSPDEFRALLEKNFKNVFLFAQNDAIISVQNLNMAWNLVAICIPF